MDTLPDEILYQIISYLDMKTLLPLCLISSKFSKFYQDNLYTLVYENVSHRTRFNLKNRDIKGLLKLSKYSFKYHNIAVGTTHTLILTQQGQIYSYGHNKCGQLGLGDTNDRNIPEVIPNLPFIVQISTISDFSLVLSNNGQVYGFGFNGCGQLGIGLDPSDKLIPTLIPFINNICYVSAGCNHSLLVNGDGKVYVIGSNKYGQLGLGDDHTRVVAKLNPNLNNIVSVSAGYDYSLALTNDGHVYSFGSNIFGRAGLGNLDSTFIPIIIPDMENIAYMLTAEICSAFLTIHGCIYLSGHKIDRSPILIRNIDNIVQISACHGGQLILSGNGDVIEMSGSNILCRRKYSHDIVQIFGNIRMMNHERMQMYGDIYLTSDGMVHILDNTCIKI